MDIILINNLQVFGILGIHAHEQKTSQLIRISLRASTNIQKAAADDDIHQTVNYSTLAKMITQFVENSHFYTIEALIEALATKILTVDGIASLWLRIEKPNAVPNADSVGVEITRIKNH